MRVAASFLAFAALTFALPAGAAETAFEEAEQAARAGDHTHAERMLRRWLDTHPNDEAARFLMGRICAWKGRYTESTAWLAPLVLGHPENPDYPAALGRTAVWSGDRFGALIHLDRARVLNPGDFDLWSLEIHTLEELGGANAQAAARLRTMAERRFPRRTLPEVAAATGKGEARAFQPARAILTGWTLGVSGEGEVLDRNFVPWYGGTVDATRTWSPRQKVWVRVRETNRFSLLDTEVAAGASVPIVGPYTASFEASGSPTNNVTPYVAGYAQLGWGRGDWAADARLRIAAFRLNVVPAATLSAERYFGTLRAGYAVTFTASPDGSVPLVHAITTSWYPLDDMAFTLGASLGEEVETVAPNTVARTPSRAAWLSTRLPLWTGWTLTPEVAVIDQTAFFSRVRGRLGIERRF